MVSSGFHSFDGLIIVRIGLGFVVGQAEVVLESEWFLILFTRPGLEYSLSQSLQVHAGFWCQNSLLTDAHPQPDQC